MVKRRIHPGDEDSASQDPQDHAESHKSKLQRIMTDASMQPSGCTTYGITTKSDPVQGGVQALATSAALVPPPSFLQPSTAAHSFAAPSYQPTFGSSHQIGISGTSYQNPIDLTGTTDMANRSPQENTHPPFLDMDTDGKQTAQIESDRLMALQMQQELHREDLVVPELDSGLQFPTPDPNQLELYRQHLQSIRCVHCYAPLKIEAPELIQRTRRMLKSSRRSRRGPLASETGTDRHRSFPPMPFLSQMQRVVLCGRRHVSQHPVHACAEARQFSKSLQVHMVLRARSPVSHLFSPVRPRTRSAAVAQRSHQVATQGRIIAWLWLVRTFRRQH